MIGDQPMNPVVKDRAAHSDVMKTLTSRSIIGLRRCGDALHRA
jgi:hypothetical protein